jgi:hypothetical protein
MMISPLLWNSFLGFAFFGRFGERILLQASFLLAAFAQSRFALQITIFAEPATHDSTSDGAIRSYLKNVF